MRHRPPHPRAMTEIPPLRILTFLTPYPRGPPQVTDSASFTIPNTHICIQTHITAVKTRKHIMNYKQSCVAVDERVPLRTTTRQGPRPKIYFYASVS